MGCGSSAEKKSGSEAHDAVGSAPPQKLGAIRDAFFAFDYNHNGSLSADEFGSFLEKVNANGHVLSEQEKAELFDVVDKDRSGTIQYEEFVDWVLTKESNRQEDQAESIAQWAANGGLTPLHEAAMQGDIAKVKECLDSGANVCIGDMQDVTPLHFACRCGHLEIVNALIEAKADIAAVTGDRGKYAGRMPLHAAADNGSLPVIQRLLALGADLHAKDRDGRTPLHWAAITQAGSAKPAEALLEARADVTAVTNLSRTPLHFAARAGNADVIEILVAAKADINAKNTEKGNTPLHAAAGSASLTAAQIILDAGADIDALDDSAMMPLHWAVCASRVQTVSALIEAKAQINARSRTGYTPFGLAEEWSHNGMTKLLEEAGGIR
eukprot:TRINITY_DN89117_c0_g1_i1.p1 TRINITY_DN89117_c0_g1~~TRINITY_DN89117_c0_g1_i1.p1  ORF type:complete len:382 (+),score=70.62 TRINITY_DN89117_c0_g1_i1:114-1259(+)